MATNPECSCGLSDRLGGCPKGKNVSLRGSGFPIKVDGCAKGGGYVFGHFPTGSPVTSLGKLLERIVG